MRPEPVRIDEGRKVSASSSSRDWAGELERERMVVVDLQSPDRVERLELLKALSFTHTRWQRMSPFSPFHYDRAGRVGWWEKEADLSRSLQIAFFLFLIAHPLDGLRAIAGLGGELLKQGSDIGGLGG
jgi:hypothetical protein